MSLLSSLATLCVVAFVANNAVARDTPLADAPRAAPGFLSEESLQSEIQDPPPDLGFVEEQIISGEWAPLVSRPAWGACFRMLDGVDLAASPVLRLIKGHAALATNRNDESLCLFLGTRDEASIENWEDWTYHLASENNTPRVLYLRADALARAGDRVSALAHFEAALQLANGMNAALCHNAIGVFLAETDPRLARAAVDDAISASDGQPADGVLVAFSEVDAGDWAIESVYGLCYPRDPHSQPQDAERLSDDVASADR
jgi:tetratricopeptide (TPR) repeat protein